MFHHIENHIEKMRQKPLHIKKQYTLLVSLSFTLILFGVWVVGFKPVNELAAGYEKPIRSPITALTANASDAFDYIKSFFVTRNKTQYESPIEVLPGKI